MLKKLLTLALFLPTVSISNEADGWPADIEHQIWEYFAHQARTEITSIISVDCTFTICEILLTTSEVNPEYVDALDELTNEFPFLAWNVKWSSTGRREIAPNTKAFVITLSNVSPRLADQQ